MHRPHSVIAFEQIGIKEHQRFHKNVSATYCHNNDWGTATLVPSAFAALIHPASSIEHPFNGRIVQNFTV
jgi:hypothetical protein